MLFPPRPPFFIRKYYNRFIWNLPATGNEIYLTFDDGPVPGPTGFVLDVLAKFQLKATFFCIGENIQKHPEVFNRIITDGHKVGNHTFNHLNGWKYNSEDYIENFKKAVPLISTNLFRPPYGRIKKEQADSILQTHKIIMWDVLSYDYNANISPTKCSENVINNTRPGSIIVFHDSVKAFKNLEVALPKCIEHFLKLNFTFKIIS